MSEVPGRTDSGVIDHSSVLKFNYRILFSLCLMESRKCIASWEMRHVYMTHSSHVPRAGILEFLRLLLLLIIFAADQTQKSRIATLYMSLAGRQDVKYSFIV